MAQVMTPWIGRRALIAGMSAAASSYVVLGSGSVAQSTLNSTPRQTEGPFYPVDWSGDIDNDLVVVNGEAAKAIGQIVYVNGRVLRASAEPISDAVVEIWQCDAYGIYRHSRDASGARHRDARFQGRGRARSYATVH